MPFTLSALDTILNAGSQVKYPKPDQHGQWDSSAPFMLPDDRNGYMRSPKQFVEDLQKLIPANVTMRDYLKSKSGLKPGDIDRTGDEPDPKLLNDLYGTVQIDGRIIAEQYNGGMNIMPNLFPAETPDDARFAMALSLDAIGPQLAQKRLEEIAKAVGGEIVYAKSALTQNEWGEQPGFDPRFPDAKTNKEIWFAILGFEMNQHTAGTLLEAQMFGQESEGETADAQAAA